MTCRSNIAVIGLGYVGLPLAVALARHFPVVGFDIDPQRIDQLKRGHDRTHEVDGDVLAGSSLRLTADAQECGGSDVFIVTVPTPVDADNQPDLAYLLAATRTVAGLIDPDRRPIIVYESTVYPGLLKMFAGSRSSAAPG